MDTITKSFNKKIGEFQFEKKTFAGNLEDLKQYDIDFYNKLNKMDGDVKAAINSSIRILIDSLKYKGGATSINDSTFGATWVYNYADSGFSQKLSGESRLIIIPTLIRTKIGDKDTFIVRNKAYPNITLFGQNELKLKLTYGFSEEKNRYKVWATCPSDKVNVTNLTGFYYIPKESSKKWVIGIYGGYGINYDNRAGVLKPGFSIGGGIMRKLWEF
jgi:hypothetical protein